MTEQQTADRDVSFIEALRRVWVAYPTATIRNVFFAVLVLVLTALQVAMFVMADNRYAAMGFVLLPIASFCLLHGWAYQRQGERALGLLLVVLGAFVPFYLQAM